ncbi:Ion channel [Necator americanus]|uniref:Ion channel n=1 Tax=Necator americanus TaxID=51031 RepID=W2T5J0_NECAM|nr:Ion channel [Necator americanus]ETN77260.1 Ion channel [Necator americanus]
MAVVLGATSYAWDDYFLKEVHLYMESVLALFFLSEFFVRMWSVSADAKYVGCRGRLRYLTRLVSIVDIIIIVVTIMMVYLEKRYVSDGTLDYLRLVQILRLFHIDRQMSTWRLIKNMIMLSKWELLAAYYITFILCLLMVNLIFISENEGFTWQIPKNSSEITKSGSFPTLAHAWWFTIVSILTIGYGDIVPSQWTSRIIVCFLGFLAYCTFVAASTQISVGLTLMMEEDNKKECRNKIRSTAASVIQCWYRFHLASEAERKMTEYFRRICFKLYVTDKRMNRNHQLAAKLRENVVKRKKMRSTVVTPDSWKQQLGIGVAQHIMQTINFEVPRNRRVTELKRNWVIRHRGVFLTFFQLFSMKLLFRVSQRQNHIKKWIPVSLQRYTNVEDRPKLSYHHHLIFPTLKHASIRTTCTKKIDRIPIHLASGIRVFTAHYEIDDWRLYKYKPLLRFFNFLLFREYTKKFRRLRKADLLLELDAEIREQENVRQQNLRELELRVNAMLGRPTTSPFHSNESEKLCMSRRLDLCESKMLEMRRTMDKIHILVRELAKILELFRLLLQGGGSDIIAVTILFEDNTCKGKKVMRMNNTTEQVQVQSGLLSNLKHLKIFQER